MLNNLKLNTVKKSNINTNKGMNKDTDSNKQTLHKYIFGENISIDNPRSISEGNSSWGYSIDRMTESIRSEYSRTLRNKVTIVRSERPKYYSSFNHIPNISLDKYIDWQYHNFILKKHISPSDKFVFGVDPAYHSDGVQGEGIIIRREDKSDRNSKIVAEYPSRNQSNIDKVFKQLPSIYIQPEDLPYPYNTHNPILIQAHIEKKRLDKLQEKKVKTESPLFGRFDKNIDTSKYQGFNGDFNSPLFWIDPSKEQPIDKYKAIILEQLDTKSVSISMKFNDDSSIRIHNNNIDLTIMQPDMVDAIKQLLIKTLK